MPQHQRQQDLDDFFRDFLNREGARHEQPRRMTSLGSGFIIDPAGYIVTNNHVIADADEITVLLHDNEELKATIVGRDEKTDLALLKVEAKKPLPAVNWGDSDALRIGDWVMAIGNPFGLGGTVTAGIVSARQPAQFRPVRRLHPDRRLDQPGQFRRSAVRHGRRGDRHQHRDLFADRRFGRHRFRDPVEPGQAGDGADPAVRQTQARLARRPHPDRETSSPKGSASTKGALVANVTKAARPTKPASSRATWCCGSTARK